MIQWVLGSCSWELGNESGSNISFRWNSLLSGLAKTFASSNEISGQKQRTTYVYIVIVQSLSRVQLFATPWTAACRVPLSFTISQSLLKLRSIESRMPSHPLSPPSPLAFSLSQLQGLFQWVSPWHQVAKVLEFQLQHQSFQWTYRVDFL